MGTLETPDTMNDHSEHVTVRDALASDCLEGECEHLDDDGNPDDYSACPKLTVEVCVDCMAEWERGRNPSDWDDMELAEWPCLRAVMHIAGEFPEPHDSEGATGGR